MVICFCDNCGSRIKGLSNMEWVEPYQAFTICKKCKNELDKRLKQTKKEFFKNAKTHIKTIDEFKQEFEKQVLGVGKNED